MLRPIVAREYRATQSETAERYFTCKLCGTKGEVAFRAEGESGWVREGLLDDGSEAVENAREAAETDLMLDADRVLGLIRCPTCGERNPGYQRWSIIRPVALAAITGGLAIGGMELVAFTVISGLLTIWVAWREISRFRRADRARLLRVVPGVVPLPAPRPAPKQLPAPKIDLPAPDLPKARAITAPPLKPIAPRGADEEPAFLRKKD